MINTALIIRTDADSRIGHGHMMRCLALAEGWQENRAGPVTLITTAIPENLSDRLISKNIVVIQLETPACSMDDARKTTEISQRLENRWVIVDGYQFTPEYLQHVHGDGNRLLYIDDYGHLSRYPVDVILNPNVYAHEKLYKGKADRAKFLMGLRYAMLRAEFRSQSVPSEKGRKDSYNLLITMGGADPHNNTSKVLRGVDAFSQTPMAITVVVGSSYPHLAALRKQAETCNHSIEIMENVDDMSALMANSDIAITAAGSTCWELMYMGVPFITVTASENQIPVADHLDQIQVGRKMGWHQNVSEEAILDALGSLLSSSSRRMAMSERGKSLVDGKGAIRVAQFLQYNR
jgi:UDP-2,4-diacetamido-2,4,6-trideoxy-beta-L-altropyranose hydrolase